MFNLPKETFCNLNNIVITWYISKDNNSKQKMIKMKKL